MKYLIIMLVIATMVFGQDQDIEDEYIYYAIMETNRDTISFRNDSLIVDNYSKWSWQSQVTLVNISFLGYDYYKMLRKINIVFDDDLAEQIERIFESETIYGSIPDARWIDGRWHNTICLKRWAECRLTGLHIHGVNQ